MEADLSLLHMLLIRALCYSDRAIPVCQTLHLQNKFRPYNQTLSYQDGICLIINLCLVGLFLDYFRVSKKKLLVTKSNFAKDHLFSCLSFFTDALTLETSCPKNPPGHSWEQPCRQSSGKVGHVSSSDVTAGECR